MTVEVRVLGSVEVRDSGGEVVPLAPQVRRLVAVLCAAGGAVSRDRIAEYVVGQICCRANWR